MEHLIKNNQKYKNFVINVIHILNYSKIMIIIKIIKINFYNKINMLSNNNNKYTFVNVKKLIGFVLSVLIIRKNNIIYVLLNKEVSKYSIIDIRKLFINYFYIIFISIFTINIKQKYPYLCIK